eukprot:6198717-Pleurochrysis_carterae.AAC.2
MNAHARTEAQQQSMCEGDETRQRREVRLIGAAQWALLRVEKEVDEKRCEREMEGEDEGRPGWDGGRGCRLRERGAERARE